MTLKRHEILFIILSMVIGLAFGLSWQFLFMLVYLCWSIYTHNKK